MELRRVWQGHCLLDTAFISTTNAAAIRIIKRKSENVCSICSFIVYILCKQPSCFSQVGERIVRVETMLEVDYRILTIMKPLKGEMTFNFYFTIILSLDSRPSSAKSAEVVIREVTDRKWFKFQNRSVGKRINNKTRWRCGNHNFLKVPILMILCIRRPRFRYIGVSFLYIYSLYWS